MQVGLLLRVLALRARFRQRERWNRGQLLRFQSGRLAALREFAYRNSEFYRKHHAGLFDRPLSELPIVDKATLMGNFDSAVTDKRLRLSNLYKHLSSLKNDDLYLGRYRVMGTSGTTGTRGVFVYDQREWAEIIASYARTQEWGGLLSHFYTRVRTAMVSSIDPSHQSCRISESCNSPFVPMLRLDATKRMQDNIDALDAFKPDGLAGYSRSLELLAQEQLEGRLKIAPKAVFCSAEILSEKDRRTIRQAWGMEPFNSYAATETGGIATECPSHDGLHLFEDQLILESVDENNKPVPDGEVGAKVLVTTLFSRTLPLIRYEISDRIALEKKDCSCGRGFRLIRAPEGRAEEILRVSGVDGRKIPIHPRFFHDLFDALSGQWQVVLEKDESIEVRIVGYAGGTEQLERRISDKLRNIGSLPRKVVVRSVSGIAKNPLGKTPYIVRAHLNDQTGL